jgi:hypothetical protein
MFEIALRVIALGIGATLLIDAWAPLLKHVYSVTGLDFRFVGRWIGLFARSQFAHTDIRNAPEVKFETLIGWAAHYATGVLFAAALVAVSGFNWLEAPTIAPALAAGIVTVAAPFFVMQPALGFGIAGSRTPSPARTRARSLVTHFVFGIGLFLAAKSLAAI